MIKNNNIGTLLNQLLHIGVSSDEKYNINTLLNQLLHIGVSSDKK